MIKKNSSWVFLFSLFLLFACSSKGLLNQQKHTWGMKPNKVIWLQVAGLHEEHLALLKFYSSSILERNQFEKFHCLGKAWNFNMNVLRGGVEESFLSQMTGALNLESSCENYLKKPTWRFDKRMRHQVGFFNDKPRPDKCFQEKKKFFENVTRWHMSKKPTIDTRGEFFILDEKTPFRAGGVYYDKSCGGENCFNSFDKVIKHTFSRFIYGKNFYFYVARVNALNQAIKKRSTEDIYVILKKLNDLIGYFKTYGTERDTLLLVSGAGAKAMLWPGAGHFWKSKKTLTKGVLYERPSTQSVVFSYGSKAEAFCGLFREGEMAERLGLISL